MSLQSTLKASSPGFYLCSGVQEAISNVTVLRVPQQGRTPPQEHRRAYSIQEYIRASLCPAASVPSSQHGLSVPFRLCLPKKTLVTAPSRPSGRKQRQKSRVWLGKSQEREAELKPRQRPGPVHNAEPSGPVTFPEAQQ